MAGSSPGGNISLREHFGEKTPDITRKITACVACRKQKIKCHMKDGEPPCSRCKKRGLPCTVNKSLQTILLGLEEGDSAWKDAVERRIATLEAGLAKVNIHLSLPDEMDQDEDDDDGDQARDAYEMYPQKHTLTVPEKHTPHNFEIVMDPEAGPAAMPGSVVSPIASFGVEPSRTVQDIITRGVVTMEEAQKYLDVYQDRLDHFLYRIIGDRRTLAQVRAGSPLLLAAICAVGSLHLASPAFEKYYQEFINICATSAFSRCNSADDIRGLCVAAFWLSSISWTCIGAAVRMSAEMQLHRSIFKALEGDRNAYSLTRLHYLLFVCDHHFSVVFGRAPMTREDDSIRAVDRFLETENAVEDDARLISQVYIWCCATDIYDTFGIDVERPLDRKMVEPLRRFGIRLDNIRADWTERFSYNRYVGNYPRKGVGLHYHFAKLYLYSMAFRGVGKPGFKSADVALDIDDIANAAVLSATAILRAVVSDTEIQSYLNGLPTYFDVMIAFAVVFVLKVSTKYSTSVRVDTSEIRTLVAELVTVLKNVTSAMHPRHLLSSVARGAETLLEKSSPVDLGPVPSNAHVTMSQPTFDDGLYSMQNGGWNSSSYDNFYMGEFDFLSNQDAFSAFQPYMNFQAFQTQL